MFSNLYTEYYIDKTMIGLLKQIFVGIVFSCYYFPFEFTFLPGINTKMVLAVIGIMLFAFRYIEERNYSINRDFIFISLWAMAFSLFSLFSVVYNNTTDTVYATYIVKMWVWYSAAYTVLCLIRKVHREIYIQQVFHYMAWVCAVQSVLSIVIDNVPVLQQEVDRLILQDIAFLHKTHRLYGIGAYFDTAGIRFSCALLGLGYLLTHKTYKNSKIWYWGLFFIIGILGNVMSRTTIVGLVISAMYMVMKNFSLKDYIDASKMRRITNTMIFVGLLAGTSLYFYNTNSVFRNYLQYGFEGFFNWYGGNEWSTNSTDKLQRMVVFPDNMKTWLIGDGWFAHPDYHNTFYKFTDVGYLRFIFYCGTVGLGLFFLFFINCTYLVCRKAKKEPYFFVLILLIQLIVWIKISTDIFLVYALLLLLDRHEPIQSNIQSSKYSTL